VADADPPLDASEAGRLAPLPEPGATDPRRRRRIAVDITPLRRHREFRLLYIGRGVSFLGTMATYVAVPYQVYALTGSSAMVGLVGLLELAVILSVAFVAGALADASDRRSLVLGSEAALGVCAGLLALNASFDHPALWPVLVLAALMSGLSALQRPSRDALIPRLVDRDELAAASALESLEGTIGMVAGPALAGVLIASVGLGATYLFDVATFVVSLGFLVAMRAVPPPEDAERPSVRRVVEGLRYAGRRQELIGTYVVDVVAMVFGMPMALFPAMAEHFGGARAIGVLYAAPSVGAFLASVTSGWATRVHRHGVAILFAAGGWGIAVIAFGLAPTLPIALVALVVAGGADMISGVFRVTLWNETIPDALRGRLASIEMVSYTSGPLLGNAEAGLAASAVGLRGSIVSGGVLCVVGVAVCAVALPAFRSYDARPDAVVASPA
jgi:MFS family permease